MRIIKVSYNKLPANLHNSLRFWALRQTDQNPKEAEKLARHINAQLSRLSRDRFEGEALDEIKINGWDGLVTWLKRLEIGDHWINPVA
jgi:hypothetical protein